ncbi:MAG: hypothetical protein Q9224_007664 [Gallowayella concinna]
MTQEPKWLVEMEVNVINSHLTEIYQQTCCQILGEVSNLSEVQNRSISDQDLEGFSRVMNEQFMLTSIHLYKQAAASSNENEIVVLTINDQQQGLSTLDENLKVLQLHYQGKDPAKIE